MAKIVGVTACPTGIAHTLMAAEALRRVATNDGHVVHIECQGSEGVTNALGADEIAEADVVVIAADIHVDATRFTGKTIYETSTSRAIRETAKVIGDALAAANVADEIAAAAPAPEPETAQSALPPADDTPPAGKRIVAITSCPTGIAHTFMAADALKKTATAAGHQIKVETQGSVGAKDALTPEDVAAADIVIISADTHVDESRFAGKPIYRSSVGAAVKKPKEVIDSAFREATVASGAPQGAAGGGMQSVAEAKAALQARRSGPYKHMLTGVSYMLPVVVAGGLCIALSFVFGIEAFKQEGTLAAALMQIGGGAAFQLMVPVLSGYIAFSIADRPGLTPGLIGGLLATQLGAGFLGGIVSGFLAGYMALWLRENIKLPPTLEGLKPVLILPLLSTLFVGLMMIYVVGGPVKFLNDSMTQMLQNMGQGNAVALGLVLGAMMAFDMGGPVNKAAYAFAVGLLASDTFTPMAAVMAAGMTPPLGIFLAAKLVPNRFTLDEREAANAAAVLGLSFITEGAIPYAARDPLRVIPAMMIGSAVTGAMSMYFNCGLRAPHGGVFVLAIPNAVSHLGMYVVSIVTGTIVTALALAILKKPVDAPARVTTAA
ncbi:PTS fructose-like transporter subunit IIB [Tropicimonas sp.]|uniref:PTS fructose-like transporter subunit IIB n=1 Tax=Tropicimonas sp. TaxID=2067044 RepID=UPI003A8A96BB